jgi:7,8-dihydropterin-6-yl-methyl-4-(beta-D-ribofuranosyl)aminobenzene 5'-phosphate synthase
MRWILVALLLAACGEATTTPKAPEGDHILNLYDAFGPRVEGVVQDFGFSALIRYRGRTILFDSGTNAAVFAKNVKALGVDLKKLDFAVLSHTHFDHISGFDHVLAVNPKLKIYFPPDPFWGAPLPFDITGRDPQAKNDLPKEQRYFGGGDTKITLRSSGRFWKANVEFVKGHIEIEPGVNLVVTRSPFLGYFSKYPSVGIAEMDAQESPIKQIKLTELTLSLSTDEGEVLVVGCSHSLVNVIAKTAKEHLKRPIAMVLGGFHLLPYDEQEIRGIATEMRDTLGVKIVAPAHCTGHLGFKVFRDVFGANYRLAGLGSTVALP